MVAPEIRLDQYFSGFDDSRALYESVTAALDTLGDYTVRATKSQVAFRRRIGFAWVWIPAKYLSGDLAFLVLTIALPRQVASTRWKQVVEPRPGRYVHHLELWSAEQVDDEVRAWLAEAWEGAA